MRRLLSRTGLDDAAQHAIKRSLLLGWEALSVMPPKDGSGPVVSSGGIRLPHTRGTKEGGATPMLCNKYSRRMKTKCTAPRHASGELKAVKMTKHLLLGNVLI